MGFLRPLMALSYKLQMLSILIRTGFKNSQEFSGVNYRNEMFTDLLRHLKKSFRRIRPEKWRTNIWFLLHDNAPAHRSVLIKDFLSKKIVTTLERPHTDLAPDDFYLFPRLKSTLKGRRFCDATDIKNATEELKMHSQNGFHGCCPHLYSHWQNLIVAQRGYFERNVA